MACGMYLSEGERAACPLWAEQLCLPQRMPPHVRIVTEADPQPDAVANRNVQLTQHLVLAHKV